MFNFFESYGSQASQTTIIGQLLKFSKGDWLIGTNNTEVKPGKQLVAIMDQLSVGWVKWEDNKPVEQLMGLIVEGHVPLKRKDLGDTDESQWEVDMQGKPRDPWQFTNNLVLREVGLASNDEDHMYTFATSSRGGISAIGELCKSFGKAMRQRPDEYPIIELATDSYVHPIKEYGRIKTPVMNVISWEKKEPVAEQKAIPARKAK
jgi:hypothetical protein